MINSPDLPANPEPEQRKVKGLLVEDSEPFSEFLKQNLDSKLPEGSQVLRCESVEQAMQIIEEGGLDFVITDNRLTGDKTGFNLAKWIKEKKLDFPVIMMTGDASNFRVALNSPEKLKRAGLDALVGKTPNELQTLSQTVMGLVEKQRITKN